MRVNRALIEQHQHRLSVEVGVVVTLIGFDGVAFRGVPAHQRTEDDVVVNSPHGVEVDLVTGGIIGVVLWRELPGLQSDHQ